MLFRSLFWAISAGIVTGAGLIPLAVFGSLFIGVILWVFSTRKPTDQPYILVVDFEGEGVENEIMSVVKSSVKKHVLRSKTLSASGTELTIEVRLADSESAFLNKISEQTGVKNAVLVSYNGEYVT